VNVQRRDLGFDPPGVTQQQITLCSRRLMPMRAVGLIGAQSSMPTPMARRQASACSVSTSSSR